MQYGPPIPETGSIGGRCTTAVPRPTVYLGCPYAQAYLGCPQAVWRTVGIESNDVAPWEYSSKSMLRASSLTLASLLSGIKGVFPLKLRFLRPVREPSNWGHNTVRLARITSGKHASATRVEAATSDDRTCGYLGWPQRNLQRCSSDFSSRRDRRKGP